MFSRILVPTDGSALPERTVLAAVTLARRLYAELVGLTVIPVFHAITLNAAQLEESATHFRDTKQAEADRNLTAIAGAAHEADVRCCTESVVSEEPWRAIVDCAEKHRCDVIVMASHGRRGIRAALLGSEPQKVLVHSAIPVLVCR